MTTSGMQGCHRRRGQQRQEREMGEDWRDAAQQERTCIVVAFRDVKEDPEFNQLFLRVQHWGTHKPIKSNKGRDVG